MKFHHKQWPTFTRRKFENAVYVCRVPSTASDRGPQAKDKSWCERHYADFVLLTDMDDREQGEEPSMRGSTFTPNHEDQTSIVRRDARHLHDGVLGPIHQEAAEELRHMCRTLQRMVEQKYGNRTIIVLLTANFVKEVFGSRR